MSRGSRFRKLALAFPACLLLAVFTHCQLDPPSVSEERYVTVRLNDSLKRYDSVEITILAAGDTGIIIGKMWNGALNEPGAIPSFKLDEGENRPLAIRVRGFDSTGALTLDMLISKVGGTQTVADLPVPLPPKPADSAPDFAESGYKDWKYHRKVDIKANYVGFPSGTVIRDFPLLVRLNNDNFDFTQAGQAGTDVRVSTADGKPIAYEIAHWEADGSSGRADIWVALDTVRGDDDSARVYLHSGNDTALDASDGAKVFDAEKGFSGAWHFSETAKGASEEFRDATGRNHGTGGGGNARNLTSRAPGVVGYAQEFKTGSILTDLLGLTGQSFIAMPRDFDPGESAWTFQFWINRNGGKDGVIFDKGDAWETGKQRFRILCKGDGSQIVIRRDGAEFATNVYLPNSVFNQISLTYDGGRLDIYADGILREGKTFSQGANPIGKAAFGAGDPDGSGDGFKGILDEPWFSRKVRGPEWLRFAFETQKPGSKIVWVHPPISAHPPK